ncbi:hypothetical protein CDAR_379321 [Caerostris darwini]|uniref:Uncharacterized protein n=1 Tax=Caerostris darwini TaxID=1538125 RepID=A0AAV4VAI1_9ARAC|nr:hypothetical protein CDAR_379321 [Caerostris darwini]
MDKDSESFQYKGFDWSAREDFSAYVKRTNDAQICSIMCYVALKILKKHFPRIPKKMFRSRSQTFLPSRPPNIPSISPLFEQENDNHVVWETGSHVTILEKITKRTNRMSYLSKKRSQCHGTHRERP